MTFYMDGKEVTAAKWNNHKRKEGRSNGGKNSQKVKQFASKLFDNVKHPIDIPRQKNG